MSQPPELPNNDPRNPNASASGDQMDTARQFPVGGMQPMSGSEAFDQPKASLGKRRFQFTRIGLFALVGAIALGIFTFQQYKLASKSKTEPTTMKLADLMTSGPGDNLYLELQDVYFLDQPAVVESKERNEDRWSKIWIDATPSVKIDDIPDVNGLDLEQVQQLQAAVGVVSGRAPAEKLPADAMWSSCLMMSPTRWNTSNVVRN